MKIQLNAVILLVLIVFSINVLVLSYLSGALTADSLSSLKQALYEKIPKRKAKLPPWEVSPIPTMGNTRNLNMIGASRELEKRCKEGFYEAENIVFCKTKGRWIQVKNGKEETGVFQEVWSKPKFQEVALY